MKKIKQSLKRVTALLLAVMLFSLAGCKNSEEPVTNEGSGSEVKENHTDEETTGNAKGRYLESEVSLPEDLSMFLAMEKLEDGSIVILDAEKGAFISGDGGASFQQKDTYLRDNLKGAYVMEAVIGKDGSYFVNYLKSSTSEDGTEDDTNIYRTEDGTFVATDGTDEEKASDGEGDSADSQETDTANFVEAEGTENEISNGSSLLYIDKDGNAANIEIPEYAGCLGVLSDGTPLVRIGEKICAVEKASGNLTDFCQADNQVYYMQQIGNILYLVGGKIMQYDLQEKEFIEDPVLDDFFADKLTQNFGDTDSAAREVLLCEGDDENSIFLAYSGGLYRHVVGGNVMEEVMKGNLSSLGNPNFSRFYMTRKENGEFLIAYYDYSNREVLLKNYVYDSEAAAIPEKLLKVYSLEENNSIRQAISEYQKKNAEVYVDYEIGITDKNGMTQEDAIRNLNTKILGGEGPDIILLDGMSVQTYAEKGILADLSPMLTKDFEQGAFFDNILGAYKKEDKIYAIPSRFRIPVLYAEDSTVNGITDLITLADTVEKLREQNETGTILGAFNERETLKKLYEVNSPAWIAEDGTIKKEELADFLTQVKRIYEAEQKGITEEEKERHERMAAFQEELYGNDDYYLNAEKDSFTYWDGKQQMCLGRASCASPNYADYCMVTSVLNQIEKDKQIEQQIKLLPGQVKNVFVPGSIMGICENGAGKELAMDFVSYMLSEELQAMSIDTGFPVNKKAFKDSLVSPFSSPEEDEENGVWMSSSSEDGKDLSLHIAWLNEEEAKHLEEMAASLSVASNMDQVIENTILELAPAALNGEKPVEDAVNDIINRIQIYLSE